MATVNDALIVRLEANMKGLQASLDTANQRISAFSNRANSDLSRVESMFRRAGTAALSMATAWAAIRLGQGIVDAGIQMQALTAKMGAATGNAQVAAEGLRFVREEAQRLGLDFRSTADGFASFSASALRAGLTFDQVKMIFTGVSEAATGMRLSSERTALVFMALSQMASKGTVSMEELKQQLGESLPGALQVFAKAMGVSNAAFIKMIENGEVTTRDLIKLGEGLRTEFGGAAVQAAQGAQAAFNRFGNAFFELQVKLANSGFLDAIVDAVNRLTAALNDPAMQKGLSAFVSFLATVIELAAKAAAMIGSLLMKIGEFEVRAAALVGIGPGVKAKGAGTVPAQGSTPVDGGYTLGTLGTPGESAASKAAREKLERQREQLRNRVAGIRQSNFNETDPAKAAALEYAAQQKELEKALQIKAITEQQYREASLEAEIAYQERLTDVRKRANDLEVNMRGKTLDSIAGLLNVFAGKNRAIAIAMLAFDKARAIAQATMETHVAAAAALKYDPTGALSSRVMMLGYANVAAIAATGIAQLATMGASGGSSSNYGYGGSDTGSDSSSGGSGNRGSMRTVYIDFRGKTIYSQNDLRNLIEQLNEAGGDGFKIVSAA